jgi:PEP-CTERM/exosortase A-associated glycosyltransferase
MTFRVLHVLDHSIPLQSGYSFRTRAILRGQRALGWQTFHLTSPKHTVPGGAVDDIDGLRFYRTRWVPGRLTKLSPLRESALMRATARRLAEVVSEVQPDVLHVHSPILNAFPALWVGRRRIPVIYEVRAFWEDAAVDLGTSRSDGLRYRTTRALETWVLRRADHVTTICEGLKRDIVARGIPDEHVTVIPNAVDVDEFPYGAVPDAELKNRLGLAGAVVIGFVGSFYAYEGLDMLLAAFPRIAVNAADVRVLLVGGGPEEARLRSLAQSMGLGDKVVFTGRIPHAEIPRYYGIVDLLIYPRRPMRLTELVTPLKPLEAMALGRVVVASDVGGHRELIRHGETGVLFPAGDVAALGDAVVALLGERDRWPELRRRGRRFVESERTWTASVAHYEPILRRLVARTH